MRLLFVLFVCVLALCVERSLGQTTPTDYQPNTAAWVNGHNAVRAAVNPPAASMPNVQWDTAGTALAQAKANAETCVYGHKNTDSPANGQNIAAIWGGGLSPNQYSEQAFMDMWASEVQFWTYNPIRGGDCKSGETCGHYTQMIWASTTEIGCWISYCASFDSGDGIVQNAYYAVCNYAPPGNYLNEYPYVAAAGSSESPTPAASPSAKQSPAASLSAQRSPAASSSAQPSSSSAPSPAASSSAPAVPTSLSPAASSLAPVDTSKPVGQSAPPSNTPRASSTKTPFTAASPQGVSPPASMIPAASPAVGLCKTLSRAQCKERSDCKWGRNKEKCKARSATPF